MKTSVALVGLLSFASFTVHCGPREHFPPAASTDPPSSASSAPGDAGAEARAPATPHVPIVLADKQNVEHLALRNGVVYWTSMQPDGGFVRAIPIGGGTVTTLASEQNYPDSIAVDDANVYWANQTTGRLRKTGLAGGPPVDVFSATGFAIYGVAVDATHVYWTGSDKLFAMPVAGGAPATLASGLDAPGGIALVGDEVVVRVAQAIDQVPTAGGAVTVVTTAQKPQAIAADAANVYWTESDSGAVMQAPRAGGTPITLATGQNEPFGIAVDDRFVYWVTFFGDTIMRCPIGGGGVEQLAKDVHGPVAIAVDDTHIVWGSFGSGNQDGAVTVLAK